MSQITIVGSGYVGMSLAVLLGKNHKIILHDIDSKRVKLVNNRQSTVRDPLIEQCLRNEKFNIEATSKKEDAYGFSEFYIIATPTDFNEANERFNTENIENVIADILLADSSSCIIIKSTIPIGFTAGMNQKFSTKNIYFSPEFLREGHALEDNLLPSRIIIGPESAEAQKFCNILKDSSNNHDVPIMMMGPEEAESVKLFSNSFLAMRVAFFNELDTFAIAKNLNTESIINGVCSDNRIGDDYNNPSFGYGGYCLPKDSKQLLSSYENIPQNLITAIVKSNDTRKKFLSHILSKKNLQTVGFYRLVAKKDSDNFRSSAISSLIAMLKDKYENIFLYEPLLASKTFEGIQVIKSLPEFIEKSELIIANRVDSELENVSSKVFSRDIFKKL